MQTDLKADITGKIKEARPLLEFHFNIAIAPTRNTKRWKNSDISWKEFCAAVESPIVTSKTAAEYKAMKYKAMTKTDRDQSKDTGSFVGGYLENGIRRKNMVKSRTVHFLRWMQTMSVMRMRSWPPCGSSFQIRRGRSTRRTAIIG